MGYIFDIILVLLLLVSVIIGFKKGLFSVVKRFRLIISVFLAWQLKLTGFVKNIVGKIFRIDRNYFHEKIQVEFGDKLKENLANTALSDGQKFDETFGKLGKLLSGTREYFLKRVTESAENMITDITNVVAGAVYDLIYGIIGFLILLAFFFILFTVLYFVINKILDVGVLGFVNHLLGGILGFITGFIWMWLLALLFVKFFPAILNTEPSAIVDGFGVVRWFNNDFFLSGIFGVNKVL